MGVYAVDELLRGNSNLVVCEKQGKLISTEIKFALVLDKLYKGTLKEGEIEAFSPEQVAEMKAIIAKKMEKLSELYEVGTTINL